jgi:hypothetical protein
MAEIEVHTHHEASDPTGRRVGVLVGLIGIVLAVVTIASHREHTAAVVHKTEANDQWAYYQAKRIREHTAGVASTLLDALATDPARSAPAKEQFEKAAAKYKSDAADIEKEARARDAESERAEHRALYFDIGEGLLELGLVLSSLYFLGREKLFPLAGSVSAVAGALLALFGALH